MSSENNTLRDFFLKLSAVTGDTRIKDSISLLNIPSVQSDLVDAFINNEYLVNYYFKFDLSFLTLIEEKKIIPFIRFSTLKTSLSDHLKLLAKIDVFITFGEIISSYSIVQNYASNYTRNDLQSFIQDLRDRKTNMINNMKKNAEYSQKLDNQQSTQSTQSSTQSSSQSTQSSSQSTQSTHHETDLKKDNISNMMNTIFDSLLSSNDENNEKIKSNAFINKMKDIISHIDIDSIQKDISESGINTNELSPMELVQPLLKSFMSSMLPTTTTTTSDESDESQMTGIEKVIQSVTKNIKKCDLLNTFKNVFESSDKNNDSNQTEAPFQQSDIMECFQSMTTALQSEDKMKSIFEKMGINNEENVDMFKNISSVLPVILQFINQSKQNEQNEHSNTTTQNPEQIIQGILSSFKNSSDSSNSSVSSSFSFVENFADSEDLKKIFEIIKSSSESGQSTEDVTEKSIMRISQYFINKNRTKNKKQLLLEQQERLRIMDPDVPLIRHGEYDEMEQFFDEYIDQHQPEVD